MAEAQGMPPTCFAGPAIATDAPDLETLANRKPAQTVDWLRNNPITNFSEGAYSFPHDWWLGIHWVLGMHGVYGGRLQRNCRQIGTTVDAVLDMAMRGLPFTYKLTRVTLRYLLFEELTNCPSLDEALRKIDRRKLVGDAAFGGANWIAKFGGRAAGGVFTLYASTGGRFGHLARSGPQKTGYVLSNIFIASMGSIVKLVIHSRGKGITVLDVALAVLTGDTSQAISASQWRSIAIAAQHCPLPLDQRDKAAYEDLHRSLQQGFRGLRHEAQSP